MADAINFTKVLMDLFMEGAVSRTYDKGDFILREGEVENNLYFIESGAVRILMLTEFEEHTIRLGYANAFINSLGSYVRKQPSEFFIEVLRRSLVKVVSRESIDTIVNRDADMAKAYITLLEQTIAQQIDREVDILTSSPKVRLERVLARSPHLFQEVPLKYIASYLRMTPETLSRLRNS